MVSFIGEQREARLFEPIENIPPAEFEAQHDGSQEAPAMVAGLTQRSLRRTRGASVLSSSFREGDVVLSA